MSSLKPHKRTAARTRVSAATAVATVVIGLTPATTVAAPVNPLVELGNRLDSISNLPANMTAPEGIELSDGDFEVPDSISLPSSSDESTDPSASKPTSYRPDQIAHPYPLGAATDNWFYFYVVHPFVELGKNHPEAMDQNLETVVRINSVAKDDPQAQELALDDNYLNPLANISATFSADLGQHFRDTFDEGRLPKAEALLPGNLARGGDLVSSTFFERYAYGYDRLFVVAPEHIECCYREGQGDPYSTAPFRPSDHTNKAVWTLTMLVMMLPGAAPQVQARASETGYSRLIMDVRYPLDVMGGRMIDNQAAADHWADPEFRPLIEEAMDELRAELEYHCGDTITNCVTKSTPYMSIATTVQQYIERMTYDFKQVSPVDEPVVVPKRCAGLLETRFLQLTEEQRSSILARTAVLSGYPLDRIDGEGQYVRMNLARALAANVVVNADGNVTVTD